MQVHNPYRVVYSGIDPQERLIARLDSIKLNQKLEVEKVWFGI